MKMFRLFGICISILVITISYKIFLNPHMISVGGLTGLCVLAETYLKIPYSVSLLLINIGLFIWALRLKGTAYVASSLATMIALGLLLDFPIHNPEGLYMHSRFFSMIFGALLSGAGYGACVALRVTTGGSELLGVVLNTKFPSISVGTVMTGLDFIVIAIGGCVEGLSTFVFSLAAVILCNATVDIIVYIGGAPMPTWMEVIGRYSRALQKWNLKQKTTFGAMIIAVVGCIFLFLLPQSILGDIAEKVRF